MGYQPTKSLPNWTGIRRRGRTLLACIALVMAIVTRLGVVSVYAETDGNFDVPGYKNHPAGNLIFTRDIAPIVYRQCAGCHRPEQSAPFSLLEYAQVKKHISEITKLTLARKMPPWAPEHSKIGLAGERWLTSEELGMLQQWIAEGAVEGNPAELPPQPEWPGDWQLGTPDLVVELPPYSLAAAGRDIYRNLVAPIPLPARRLVRAVEFQPGNARVVHHAYVQIDETRQSRRRAERENPPGFDGMDSPESVIMPGGQLLGWQPGKIPSVSPDGLAWVLKPGTDLVLQMHLTPTGKPEQVQPKVGFYFTDKPPTNSPFRLRLTSLIIDIPAGVSNYVAEESYILPIDATLARVGAHAHYLGRNLEGYAILPGGERKDLFHIPDWDPKWQGDYTYVEPPVLPKGTKVAMRFSYDNSTNNARNPNTPPQRVKFGPQIRDEMGALYFQVLPVKPSDYPILAKDYSQYFLQVSIGSFRKRIESNPFDAEAHKRLGRALGYSGQTEESLAELNESVRLNPADAETRFDLGSVYIRSKRIPEAYAAFQAATKLDPTDAAAFGSLGICAAQLGKLPEAQESLKTALRLNPDDRLAQKYLEEIAKALDRKGN